jgi:hypothetical protein
MHTAAGRIKAHECEHPECHLALPLPVVAPDSTIEERLEATNDK